VGDQNIGKPGSINVLFLCTGNSARSALAEAMLNDASIGRGQFRAFSAGSHPRGAVHPFALELLTQQQISTQDLRSKSWNEFADSDAPAMDFIFTVCDSAANEACPVWPGHPVTAHWSVPDPAAVTGPDATRRAAFLEAFLMLRSHIEAFVHDHR
jgi:arsenate reductase